MATFFSWSGEKGVPASLPSRASLSTPPPKPARSLEEAGNFLYQHSPPAHGIGWSVWRTWDSDLCFCWAGDAGDISGYGVCDSLKASSSFP